MWTVDKVRRHFGQPHEGAYLTFWFHQKRDGYPRESYRLMYRAVQRSWVLTQFVMARRGSLRVQGESWDTPNKTAPFAGALTGQQAAKCIAASLNPQGDENDARYPRYGL